MKRKILAVIFVLVSVLAIFVSCGKQGSDERKDGNDYAFVFDVKYIGGSDIWNEEKALVQLEEFRLNLENYADILNRFNKRSESEENTMKNMAHKCALTLTDMKCFEGSISLKRGSETIGSWSVGGK